MLLLFRGFTKGNGCLPPALIAADALLTVVDGAIAALAFFQLLRIHFRNQQLGWTRQKIDSKSSNFVNISCSLLSRELCSTVNLISMGKGLSDVNDCALEMLKNIQIQLQAVCLIKEIFHLIIGSSNIGYLMYFTSSLLATCGGWQCWLHGCGFILMACPQILFFAAFLLLLSFWVDLCHQAKDEEEDDENGISESFLEKATTKPGPLHFEGRRRCCSFRNVHVGSRQKFVILVMLLTFTFVLMSAFALLIWGGRGKNPINSSLMARVYQDIFSVAMLLLGGALACYGFLLFSKMRKVRSEMASTEMWKVASLAAVTLVCFTSCSILALVTNIPVLYHWHSDHSNNIICSVFIFLYYFIGSSVPSGFVLWIMRDIPPPVAADRPPQSRVVTFVRDRTTGTNNPQWRATVASSQSKVQY